MVHDARTRAKHDVDVAAVGIPDGDKPPLLAIGEAKWNDTMGIAHLERLRQIRDVIGAAGRYDVRQTRLLGFSGAGFNDRIRAAADESDDIVLVGLPELYA